MNQKEIITDAERELGCGPVELAQLLNTPYHTLKDWKSGRSKMPGIALVAINALRRLERIDS